ncbi:ubiquitin carboxyl-terminal hydrolase CYLD [Xenopus laevis]|uniref:Ubiquitin carboxyl-terminal hydrolase CYLD n=2 Tax=Xenopus laevis TaxID=8355 RepID=A0A1L8EU43_XENLA|nr:ubiquitin carboxyl-terminal hydrolase CYLD [Xenopus laevis]OCT62830.1 hypothetical protein XELAEV_18043921mg [Xenopus laevis]
MGTTVKSRQPFIVMQDFIAGRHKIIAGSMGEFLDGDQTRGRILDLPAQPEVPLKKNPLKMLGKRDSSFLYAIGLPVRRLNLLANAKLFQSVCNLQISDVVRVRCQGFAAVGVTTGFWEQSNRSELSDFTKLLIEVELLVGEYSGEEPNMLKVNAGEILSVSSNIQFQPYSSDIKPSFSSEDIDLKDIPPIRECDVLEKMVGQRRGIQGHHNSCYLDTTLFSIFTFSSILDHILHSADVCDAQVQRILRQDIVNPLRRNGFVQADNVMKLRKLLRCETFVTEEKDPEEFLNALLHEVLAVDPLLKIRCNNKTHECNCYQIIVESDSALKVPTVQTLMERSFQSCGDLKFDQVPSCLILQMPRFGKTFKTFPFIFPSMDLDITKMLYQRSQVCCKCQEPADYRCSQCFADPLTTDGQICQYCHLCETQIHKQLKDHHPRRLDVQNISFASAVRLELLAVLCIRTSHFISFVKYGSGKNSWVFFDSMASRIDAGSGENIPVVRACPQIGNYLGMTEEEFASVDLTKMDDLSKRFFFDVYMCIYQFSEPST